jgi:hypothetical protein
MTGKRQVLLLAVTLAVVSLSSVGVTIFVFYNAAVSQHTALLLDIVQGQAYSIETAVEHETSEIYRYSDDYTRGETVAVALQQLRSGMQHVGTTQRSFEFTVGRRDSDQITLLIRKRTDGFDQPLAIPFASDLAQPMRLALSGYSGSLVGKDYRGNAVLGAYEYIPKLRLGLVAKVDLSEIRAPYINAGLRAVIVTILLILVGTALFVRVGGALVHHLHDSEDRLRSTLDAARIVAWDIDPVTGSIHESGPVREVYGSSPAGHHSELSVLAADIEAG